MSGANGLFRYFRPRFGDVRRYVTIDIETDGLNPETDTLCTFGFAEIADGQIVQRQQWVLDWTRHAGINTSLLREKLLNTQTAMRDRGKCFHHTWDYLATGEPPEDVLRRVLDLLERCEREGLPLIAHNGYRFDVEFIQAHCHNWLRVPYRVGDSAVYDTGVAEKAAQLTDADSPTPRSWETLRDWSARVGNIRRKGVRWALDEHCEERYQISTKMRQLLGPEWRPDWAHRSDMDALALHILFEEHRRLMLQSY